MTHHVRSGILASLTLMLLSPCVSAQYRYPAGYGGWGGWGGGATTAQGSAAMGMGMYAAGAGAYNEQTAEARSINANTAMQVNQYMYEVNLQNARTYYGRSAAKQQQADEEGKAVYQRIHDHPDAHDIHTGDALNAVITDLTNPEIFNKTLQAATQPIDSDLVRNLQFEYAVKMIAISLEDLFKNGPPDVLTGPDYQADRDAFRPLVQKARDEIQARGQVTAETLAACRAVIKGAQDKVAANLAYGTKDRNEADNYLKALYGVTKMLQTPSVDKFLKGLDKYPTTTLSQLIYFMHCFNLKITQAKTPIQETQYEQLYGMLVALRDRVQAPAANPYSAPAGKTDPRVLSQFYSGMDYSHFNAQPDPHATPAPPAPAGNP